ncbi:hypothetical protein BCAR13_710051 [Paraburkholderia caribensis]|nr:hypothetical protein BCAR13_710051 [Paraburkholderia caribensis]
MQLRVQNPLLGLEEAHSKLAQGPLGLLFWSRGVVGNQVCKPVKHERTLRYSNTWSNFSASA